MSTLSRTRGARVGAESAPAAEPPASPGDMLRSLLVLAIAVSLPIFTLGIKK